MRNYYSEEEEIKYGALGIEVELIDQNDDWTKAWSTKYPVLKRYQQEVDIPVYAEQIRTMFTDLQEKYGYSELDAMLVLKDILAHEYMDKKKK